MESNNGFEPRVLVQAQDHTPTHGHSRTTFEDLAMPLFGSLYNFAHWLAQNREDAEDLVQETFVKAFTRLRFVPAGDKFSSLDFPNPPKHLPVLAVEAGPAENGSAGSRRDFTRTAGDDGHG
jgi:hypothetical protein